MAEAKEFLNHYWQLKAKVKIEKMHIRGVYDDTYGLDLPCGQILDQVQHEKTDPAAVLIDKILKMEKDLNRIEERLHRYMYLLDFIEKTCIDNLNEQEMLVIGTKFFSGDRPLTHLEIARKLKYSEAWVNKWIMHAYMTLDQVLIQLEREKKLPIELY